jgi:lipopolysaccharide/colanic/teichoic acid biosynthesis glycosyltransferase
VLSLVGFTSCITAPVGAIMGHVARKQIRQTGEQGEGMAKAAIIVGWILTALLVLLIIFYVVMIVIAINSDSSSSY